MCGGVVRTKYIPGGSAPLLFSATKTSPLRCTASRLPYGSAQSAAGGAHI